MSAAPVAAVAANPDHARHVADCLRSPELFTPWELRFLRGMDGRAGLTRRQGAMVTSLLAKLIRRSDVR